MKNYLHASLFIFIKSYMTISKTETLIVTHHDYMPFFFECVCMCTVYPPFFLNVLSQMLHSKAENKISNLEKVYCDIQIRRKYMFMTHIYFLETGDLLTYGLLMYSYRSRLTASVISTGGYWCSSCGSCLALNGSLKLHK